MTSAQASHDCAFPGPLPRPSPLQASPAERPTAGSTSPALPRRAPPRPPRTPTPHGRTEGPYPQAAAQKLAGVRSAR